jgi:hypothetical protein
MVLRNKKFLNLILISLFLSLSSRATAAEYSSFLLITPTTLDLARITNPNSSNPNPVLDVWKPKFFTAADDLLGDIPVHNTTSKFFQHIHNKDVNTIHALLNGLFNTRVAEDYDHEDYYKFFIDHHEDRYGLSQLVLEAAYGCVFFGLGSNFRQQLCNSYPKLAIAVARLAQQKTPGRHLRFRTSGFKHTSVNVNRGLVLVRALMPIFTAYNINHPTMNGSNWTQALRDQLRAEFINSSKDIHESVEDYFALKIVDEYEYPFGLSETQRWNDYKNKFSFSGVIDKCIAAHNNRNYIRKCASNQVIAGYLGRLMVRSMAGAQIPPVFEEFKKVVEHSIVSHNGLYLPTDHYRKNDITLDGVTSGENKAVSYSLLQLRFLVMAAEIFRKHNLDLYSYHDHHLARSIDFMAHIGTLNVKNDVFEDFFENPNHVNDEFNNYVNMTAARRKEIGAYYGFFAVPINRFCNEYPNNFLPNIKCNEATTGNEKNIYPDPNTLQPSVYMGPIEMILRYSYE